MRPGQPGHRQRHPGSGFHPLLCGCFFSAVLPSLQNGHHGPGSLHIFPAGMAGRRPPKPHWFLPGRSVAAAGLHGCLLRARRPGDAVSLLLLQIAAPVNAAFVFLSLGLVSTLSFLGRDAAVAPDPATFKGRSLLSARVDELELKPFTRSEIIGFTIGSVSSVLYLCSRVPQIYTNYKRKSTIGVSYSLFALVMLGNLLYGLSVLLKNPEPGQGEGDYVLHHLPWLVGSLGVLSLDVVISFQFLAYRRGRPGTHEERDALLGEQGASLES
ncbi:lysosomal amino acid transporter 1 homolog isoform 2-T2 [Chlamydotis macqueenii]